MARASYLLEFAPFDWLVNYLSYLGPDYLFFNGDPEIRHSLLNVGQLYFFELATLPMGIFFLVRRKRKEDALLGLWLALYPIPAALTDPSHAIRSIVGVRFVSGGAFCARAKPLVVGAGVHRDGGWQRSGLWSALLRRLPRLRGRALELWDTGGNCTTRRPGPTGKSTSAIASFYPIYSPCFIQPILLRNINANHCVFSRGIGVITTSRSGATIFYRCGKSMPVHSNAVTRCCWRWPARLGKWPNARRIGSCIASRCRTVVPLSKSTNANSRSDLRHFHT